MLEAGSYTLIIEDHVNPTHPPGTQHLNDFEVPGFDIENPLTELSATNHDVINPALTSAVPSLPPGPRWFWASLASASWLIADAQSALNAA